MEQTILDEADLTLIAEAHRDWCAELSINPDSPAGQDGIRLMQEAFLQGRTDKVELIAACDEYVARRQRAVRLGAAGIASTSDQ